MYCTHCGREMVEGTSFCRFCGKSHGQKGGADAGAASIGPASGLTRLDFIIISALVGFTVLLILILAVT